MGSHGDTRRRAFDVACNIASNGNRPTVSRIREELGGGGQQAIMQGLADWQEEAAKRFRAPGIPDPIQAPVQMLWSAATAAADERWSQDREALSVQLAERDTEIASVRADLETVGREKAVLVDEVSALRVNLGHCADEFERAVTEIESLSKAISDTTAALNEAETQARLQESQRHHAERVASEARESLQTAQERIARLIVDTEVAQARVALLERSEADAKANTEVVRQDLTRAMDDLAVSRGLLSERDGQIGALTATLRAEQQARDADTEHWLGRISEQQALLAEAKAREGVLVAEKTDLVREVQQLRRDLRTSEQEAMSALRNTVDHAQHEARQKTPSQ